MMAKKIVLDEKWALKVVEKYWDKCMAELKKKDRVRTRIRTLALLATLALTGCNEVQSRPNWVMWARVYQGEGPFYAQSEHGTLEECNEARPSTTDPDSMCLPERHVPYKNE